MEIDTQTHTRLFCSQLFLFCQHDIADKQLAICNLCNCFDLSFIYSYSYTHHE